MEILDMKKWISLFLAAVILLSFIPMDGFAAEAGAGCSSANTETVIQDGGTVSARSRNSFGTIFSRDSLKQIHKTNVTVSNSYSGVTVKWEAVKDAQTYRVYRKTPGGSWSVLKTGITALSYTDTTAKSGSTYLYAVRAYNSSGGSAYSSSSEIIFLSQPEAVVTNKIKGIQVSWDKISGAKSYHVYRKTSGGDWKQLGTVTDTDYLDTTAKSGTTYYYMVRARNGSTLSSNKNRVSILRLSCPAATVSNAAKGVRVKWSAVNGAETYRVYRKTADGEWKVLASDVVSLKYTDTTAKSGVTYSYAVRAYGAGYRSGYTATEEIQYLSRPVITASTVSSSRIKLRWNVVDGATKYIVYVKSSGTDWKELYSGKNTSYTASGLTLGKTYTFSVRAISGSGKSVKSAEADAKATFGAPSYSVKLESGTGIKISWKAVSGAGSYRVYRRTNEGSWKLLKTTTSTSYVDTSGHSGTTYEYAVRAFERTRARGVYGLLATGESIVYSRIDPDKPMIALTFDDGPSAYTSDILDQLEKYGAHATFFVVGNRVSTFSNTIKRAYNLGCEIGNHSWSHPALSSISVSAMKKELSKTDNAIKSVIGIAPELLRPPYGAVDSDVRNNAGKPLIHWSIDTRDWETRNSSRTISSVLNNVRDGSIILMHDIYAATRDAAVSLIPTLIEKGYQLVTVSELAAYRGVTLKDGTIYYSIYP